MTKLKQQVQWLRREHADAAASLLEWLGQSASPGDRHGLDVRSHRDVARPRGGHMRPQVPFAQGD